MFVHGSHGNVVFLNWRDNRNVFVCSSLPEITDQIAMCKRTVMDKSTKKYSRRSISRPQLVKEYTSCMFNVDRG